MTQQEFTLSPFAPGPAVNQFTLSGAISRRGSELAISYRLTGPLQELRLAPPARVPARRWLLWETTCLEFFLAPQGAANYWEFNLSPAGDWNVFRLSSYRQGIEEEPSLSALPFTIDQRPRLLSLDFAMDFAPILSESVPLEAAVSAVLHHRDGSFSYWALIHPAPQPDFHHRQGFCIKL